MAFPPSVKTKRLSVETHVKINFASDPFFSFLQMTTYSCCPSFLVHEREEGRCGSFHKSVQSPPKAELIPGGVGSEWIDFQASGTWLVMRICGGITKKSWCQWDTVTKELEGKGAPSPGIWVAAWFMQQCYQSRLRKLTHSSPQGCAQKNQESRKRKGFSSLLQLLLREPGLPPCAVIG